MWRPNCNAALWREFPFYVQCPVSLILALAASLMLWLISFPGFMSWDSVYQYGQARTGIYTDWHPPIMAFILSLVLRAGGDIWVLTLSQSVAGWMGIRSLSISAGSMLCDKKSNLDRVASIVILLLVSPLSPLGFFLVTFWKDVWFTVLLVWSVAVILHITRQLHEKERPPLASLLVLGALTGLAGIVRHNGVVIIPVAVLVIFLVLRFAQWRASVFLAAVPVLIFGLWRGFETAALDPIKTHPEKQIYAIDLVSMAKLDPSILEFLPFTRRNLQSDFQTNFSISDNSSALIFGENAVVNKAFTDMENISLLRDEFLTAISTKPLLWLRVKEIIYFEFLLPKHRYTLHPAIEPNEFGLALHPLLPNVLSGVLRLIGMVETNDVFRWFFFVHLPWYLLNLLSVLVSAVKVIFSKKSQAWKYWMIGLFTLLLPLSYYLSYFVVVTAPDFRFMYPSTLVMQVLFVTCLFCRREKLFFHSPRVIG